MAYTEEMTTSEILLRLASMRNELLQAVNDIEKISNNICYKAEQTEPQTCDTCKWGEWYRKGYDITMMSDECGGCCSWNNKWTPKTEPFDTDINVRSKDEPRAEGVWNAGYKTGYDKGFRDARKVNDSQKLVKDLVKAFGEDGTWLERQGVYTLTLAEAKQRAVDIIESVLAKTENCSEKPNNCEDLQDWKDRMWAEAIVTEPTISKMEQVDEPQTDCGDFADRLAYERGVKHAWEVAQKVFDSTVTFYEAEDVAKQIAKDEPQYEMGMGTLICDNCSEYGSFKCTKCDGEMYFKRLEPNSEPQTEPDGKDQKMENYSIGEYIIYVNGDKYEIGRIKRICEDGCFVAYHEGETGAKTPYSHMHKLINEYCIKETTLGGGYFERME